jgi:ABC-type multidrug transport system ATPase subunit
MRAPELSSGQRQRLSLERGFGAKPKVLLLDQPTLGLDCAASHEVRGGRVTFCAPARLPG